MIRLALALAALALAAPSAHAQRRPEARATVELSPLPAHDGNPYRYAVTVRADEELTILADRRLLSLEVRAEGARRPLRCEGRERPGRRERRERVLAAGEAWAEWLDLRELCWGRALAAIEAGASVTPRFGRRGLAAVVRATSGARAPSTLVGAPIAIAAIPRAEPDAASPIVVSLADTEAGARASVRFRVSVRTREGARRAYVRSDRFRFEVRGPAGESWTCGLDPARGPHPVPDLFARLSPRGGAGYALEAAVFCPPETFRDGGIYEVVPTLSLEEDGAGYQLDAVVGSFSGRAAFVRVRGERGYVERPVGGGV